MEMNYEEGSNNGKKTLWIIGGIILVIMIVGVVYGATQRSLKKADQAIDDSVRVTQSGGTSSNGVVRPVTPSSNDPVPENMVAVAVTVSKLDVVNLESFPQRVQARVGYQLANGCAVLDTPTITKTGSTFTIALSSRAEKDKVCTQALVPGEVVIEVPVEGLAAGKYSVKVGTTTKTFTLQADNEVQFYSDK